MAEESPEQIRERVHAEELGKGSDPRVAEGRAKAAEMRAKAGLPIEPDKAWRAKLEQEGGEASEAPAAASAAEAGAEEAPAEEAPAEEAAQEAPAAEAQPEPAAEAPATAPTPAPAPAAPAAAPREPEFVTASAAPREPEVGEPIEIETEGLEVVAGVPIRNERMPAWVTGILIAVILWAVAYALFLSGPEAISNTTRCEVSADQTLVCATSATPSP